MLSASVLQHLLGRRNAQVNRLPLQLVRVQVRLGQATSCCVRPLPCFTQLLMLTPQTCLW